MNTQGIIKEADSGNIEFWVPLYKKILYEYLSPDFNGERHIFLEGVDVFGLVNKDDTINMKALINYFKEYVKKRSFKYFMRKDEEGKYVGLKEAAAGYAFSTYIDNFIQILKGQIYYEADSGLGRTDMIINARGYEYVIEFKIFTDGFRFKDGKKQVTYYANTRDLKEAYYIVFSSKLNKDFEYLKDDQEIIDGVEVKTRIIWYDEEKDFA